MDAYQTSTATRFLYQPQVGHTTWGSLAEPQRGQIERAGSDSRQALARRLRDFDLDFFFFGTAIAFDTSLESLGSLPGPAAQQRATAAG
jgi:hypothetical protein